jgi:orotidine-5'-phosphate decarboxylase
MVEPVSSEERRRARERLIVALDVDNADDARSMVRELRPSVGAFKIGLELFTAAGPGLVAEISENHRVFLDLKFHDIPNTVAAASAAAVRLGVWMLNVHAAGGAEMLRRTAAAVAEASHRTGAPRPKLIAVTVLTSTNDEELRRTGVIHGVERQVLNLAQLTAECGFDGVVASALEVEPIRRQSPDGFLIVTPGIRPAGKAVGTADDQKRVMTPGAAIAAGSDYLVVGRPVTGAGDRLEAAESIVTEIAGSLV